MDDGFCGGEKTTTDRGRFLLASTVSYRISLAVGSVGLWCLSFLLSLVFGRLAPVIGKLVSPACDFGCTKTILSFL
jgi:hypothetical protein